MEEIALKVEARGGRGKGPARRMRRTGKMPAVFYGPKRDAVPLAVDSADFGAPRRATSRART